MMHHRPPDALLFGIIDRSDVGDGIKEIVLPDGRKFGRWEFKVEQEGDNKIVITRECVPDPNR